MSELHQLSGLLKARARPFPLDQASLFLSLSPPPLLFLMLSVEDSAKALELSAVAQPFSSS